MPARWPTWPQGHSKSYPSRICLYGPFVIKRELLVVGTAYLFGFGLPQQPFAQELDRPALSVKRAVFEDGLLLVALAATGTIRLWAMGHLSLLFPDEAIGPDAIPVPALPLVCRPRPADFEVRTAMTPVPHDKRYGRKHIPSERQLLNRQPSVSEDRERL